MDLMLMRLFQSQIAFQCKVAIAAAVDVNSALEVLRQGNANGFTKVFCATRTF
jgi:hypothetical protein